MKVSKWCSVAFFLHATIGVDAEDTNKQGSARADQKLNKESTTSHRSLQAAEIYFLGNNLAPAEVFPLPLCAGDCDADTDCLEGLICFQRDGNEPVEGCLGGEDDSSSTDFCVVGPPAAMPSSSPSMSPSSSHPSDHPSTFPSISLVPSGAPSVSPAPSVTPSIAPSTAPSVSFIPSLSMEPSVTPSTNPTALPSKRPTIPALRLTRRPSLAPTTRRPTASPTTQRPTPVPTTTPPPTKRPSPFPTRQPTPLPTTDNLVERLGNDGEPENVFPLGHCKGDCDDDTDCADFLQCWQRDAGGFAPGCSGGESHMEDTDVCIRIEDMPTPFPTRNPTRPPTMAPVPAPPVPQGSFKLKLYWEDGYYWQEEDFERRWCASYNYDRSYCWYGDDSDDCEDDEMYIDDCDDGYDQLFQFVAVGGGDVLIKLANENRCWGRSGSRIYLRSCDSNENDQRWIAQNGNFDGYRFEITQRGIEDRCVSNDHHPKSREVVEMHSCEGSREGETSYWNRE